MSDFERFTEFLRRKARGYNEAPRVPVEVMWRGVEAGLGEGAAERAVDGQAVDALGYNEAPGAPRDEMWGRIEAAWGLRGGGVGVGRGGTGAEGQSGTGAGAEGVVAGLPSERIGTWRWPSRQGWAARRRVAGWAATLAAAASLVLGLVLGRDVRESQPGEVGVDPILATGPTEAADPSPVAVDPPQPVQPSEPEPPVLTASFLPVPGASVGLQAAVTSYELEPQVVRFAGATVAAPARALPRRLTVRRDPEQLRFLGRAETLLTALRTDQRTPLTERDLAVWGRELLAETRMHLDLQGSRTPMELALLDDPKLLEDLELLMLQISRLGSGAPDVEWQLARESMEIKNALPRLRAVADADGL